MSSPHTQAVKPDERLFPTSHATQTPQVVKLSEIDATAVRFSKCSAYWVFEGSSQTKDLLSLFALLRDSLCKTLDSYPHFAGQLKYATDLDEHNAVEAAALQFCGQYRTGRPVISYGNADDPGIAFRVSASDRTVSELLACERRERPNIYWSTEFPIDEIEYSDSLALDDMGTYLSLPGVAVQLTSFRCGGYALNIRTAHCLSDATTLCSFATSWANIHRGQRGQYQPIFQPELVDRHGAFVGRADPDNQRLAVARALPLHRHDWYGAGPEWAVNSGAATKPSNWDQVEHSPGTPMPWTTWDTTRPCERIELRFPPAICSQLKRVAQATLPVADSQLVISRLDAVLAHLWIQINRARNLHDSDEDVYFDATLGLRPRLGIPEMAVGSMTAMFHSRMSGREACVGQLGAVAAALRKTVLQGTAEAVGAYIHDVAFEPSPQRLWQAFLGARHVLFTSWLRLPMQELEFTGTQPLCARGVMPFLDGLLQSYEADGDIVVSLALERDTMTRLVSAAELIPSEAV